MIFIKILVLIITYANTISGIQVYENVTDDITTTTTKLVLVPTTIAKVEAVGKGNGTESSAEVVKPNDVMVKSNSTVVASQEKNARNNENGRSTTSSSSNKIEQHEKTSSNVKHEKFVPSPEISLSGIEIQQPSQESKANDNFYPLSQYYHPVKHSVHFHSSAPIISNSNSNWKHPSNVDSLQKNYPKFEEELQQQRHKEHEKLTFPPPLIDSSKWYFMPSIETTDKPSLKPSGNGKWKWVADEEDEQDKRNVISHAHLPTIPPNEFSYTYELPTTDSTPFSFNKYEGIDQPLNGEVPSTAVGSVESEWDSPFTSSGGKLKHKGKGKGKGISPWKKILHVLTAAIPIGLLISALTPQVIYVDPNATSSSPSISPSVHSLNLLSTTKQRSLDQGPQQSNVANDLVNGRKFVSNPLMDFLHVLRDNGNTMERSDSCDDRKFCEASRSGADPNASVLNKMLWKIANETPEFQARKSGLEHIFNAIRQNNCSIFECKQPDLNNHRSSNRKN